MYFYSNSTNQFYQIDYGMTTVTQKLKANILTTFAVQSFAVVLFAAFQANYAGSIPAARLRIYEPQTNEKSTV